MGIKIPLTETLSLTKTISLGGLWVTANANTNSMCAQICPNLQLENLKKMSFVKDGASIRCPSLDLSWPLSLPSPGTKKALSSRKMVAPS